MRAPGGGRGLALLSALCGLTLAECAPLIGLDEDYYVEARGGEAGMAPSAGSDGVSGGGSGGLTTAGGTAGGGTTGEAGAGGVAGAGGFVIPPGKLVFHSYTEYDTGDSAMYIVTFPVSGVPTVSENLATTYELCNPVNGVFSPDGNTLAVTAEPLANPCPMTNAMQQDVYLLDLLNPPNKIKVTGNTLPDEDPQFSPDGAFLLFKHNYHLALWNLTDPPFTDCQNLMGNSVCFAFSTPEQSKPVLHPDGLRIFYHESWGPMADIYSFDLAAGRVAPDINTIRTPIVHHENLSDARVNFSGEHLYYVRWNAQQPLAPAEPLDQIVRRPVNNVQGVDSYPEFLVDMGSDYSDPYSIDGDLVIFASDIAGEGLHDLFIADWGSAADPRSLNDWIDVNSVKDDLGGVFWRAP